jgi:Protein of unknown function (DUF3108)
LNRRVLLLCVFGILPLTAETLRYSISWPSGLNLGDAEISSSAGENGWNFQATIDASLPGYPLKDRYSASATTAFCSNSLTKEFQHGSHKTKETETFDQEKQTVARETRGGGKNDLSVGPCARDALTFLSFVRHELAQGRMAPPQQVVFGALYQVRMEFMGTQSIKVGEHKVEADRMQVTFKGPASDFSFELFFSKDPARTPVLARLPLPLGAFTVELIP